MYSNKHNAKRKIPRITRHTATLTQLYNSPHRRLPQAFTQTHKRKQEKKLPLPCCASTHSTTASRLSCLAPLVPRASRASRLSSTCASRPSRLSCLAPLEHVRLSSNVRFSSTCASQATCASQHVFSQASLSPLCRALCVRCLSSSLSYSDSHTPTCASQHTLSALRPVLFWARFYPCPPIGRGHAAPPPAFPRFGKTSRQMSRICCYVDPCGRFWRETSPPPRCVSICPAGSVTTRCTFDGECRWWWVLGRWRRRELGV